MIEVVAEKTGYPAEVLELDMQLDADLGIDSIKRVEILSALQERLPALPSIRARELGTFRTLRSIVEHMSRGSVRRSQPAGGRSPCDSGQPECTCGEIARMLLETVADKTGYPAEMLELDMRLDTDLGIDSIKRVEIFSAIQDRLPDLPAAGPTRSGRSVHLAKSSLSSAARSPARSCRKSSRQRLGRRPFPAPTRLRLSSGSRR